VDASPPVAAWLEGVAAELSGLAAGLPWPGPLQLTTVYVGGGTPSLLGPGAMAALRTRLSDLASWGPGTEWTAEANPERFDAALADDWVAAGVNRLSLGAQTFDGATLRWMGRLHGPGGPARAVREARRAGFDNISLDLMFGLPAASGRDWKVDIESALELEPEHVSLYGLTAEPATPLGKWVASGRTQLADEQTYAAEYLFAAERLTAAGYLHYEVSNFARPGRESRHNRAYWAGAAYIGLGPGAHSYLPPRRWWNVRDWTEYRTRIAASDSAVAGEEIVDAGNAALERTWLGLRTTDGIELEPASAAQDQLIQMWLDRGWAIRQQSRGSRVRLTPHGWLLLDRLAVELDAASEQTFGSAEPNPVGRAEVPA
jgi:oxygen-independent coproporphyrinogen-3 oxidase